MLVLGALVRAFEVLPGDQWAVLELKRWHSGWLTAIALGFHETGWKGAFLPYAPLGVVIFVIFRRRWCDAAFLAGAAVLSPLTNLGLKELAARPRPDAALALVEATGYAFPSGHSVFAFTFFGALIYLLGEVEGFTNHPVLLRAAQGALAFLILVIGGSRVYLGVHWPSDVIGGYLLGSLCLAAVVAVYRVRRHGL